MTPVDLEAARKVAAEARARADNATPGPWADETYEVWGPEGDALVMWIAEVRNASDATNAAARTDVPALSALVEQMAEEIESLRKRVPSHAAWIESYI